MYGVCGSDGVLGLYWGNSEHNICGPVAMHIRDETKGEPDKVIQMQVWKQKQNEMRLRS